MREVLQFAALKNICLRRMISHVRASFDAPKLQKTRLNGYKGEEKGARPFFLFFFTAGVYPPCASSRAASSPGPFITSLLRCSFAVASFLLRLPPRGSIIASRFPPFPPPSSTNVEAGRQVNIGGLRFSWSNCITHFMTRRF